MYRKTYAEINLKNILSNYNYVSNINSEKTVIPVVKANAYGHGSIKVVEYLYKNGVNMFAVSLLEEAIELRDKFPNIKILIMGVLDKDGFSVASDLNLTVTVSNYEQIDDLIMLSKKVDIHLKIDTGMNRLGFKKIDEVSKVVNLLQNIDLINVQGIYTHFATSDSDFKYYEMQKLRFENILKRIDHKFEMVHISNSSSSIKYEKNVDYTTHMRLGISLYGLTLDEKNQYLKNTYKLVSKISEIKHISAGEKVGYGATYTAQENEIIGVIPIGYADGFIRKNQNGDVEINGKRYPIVGRICMDQLFIKIDESVTKDSLVTLFGGLVSIDEVAERLDTINYEVICQITSRVPKIYIE
jgi:alanine racemase